MSGRRPEPACGTAPRCFPRLRGRARALDLCPRDRASGHAAALTCGRIYLNARSTPRGVGRLEGIEEGNSLALACLGNRPATPCLSFQGLEFQAARMPPPAAMAA